MKTYTKTENNRNTETSFYRFTIFYVSSSTILSPHSVTKMNSMDKPAQLWKSLKEQTVSPVNLSLFHLDGENMAPPDAFVWSDYTSSASFLY